MPIFYVFIIFLVKLIEANEVVHLKAQNVAINKPIRLKPNDYSCGFNGKVSLKDNRLLENQQVPAFLSKIIFCDQSCPFGKVLSSDWNTIVNEIPPDFTNNNHLSRDLKYYLPNLTTNYSYFFENLNTNLKPRLASLSMTKFTPLQLDLFAYRERSIESNGFSIVFWFQQIRNNTGTLIEMVSEKNQTQFQINLESSKNRIKISYSCSTSLRNKQIEHINTKNLISLETWNYLALRIYKNKLNLFINEPKTLIDRGSLGALKLKCNIGSAIPSRIDTINAYIGVDKSGQDFYNGWIQDLKIVLIPLTYREIYLIRFKSQTSVNYNDVRYQPHCKCPNDFPINEDANSIFCVSYEKKSKRKLSYLNKDTHIGEFLNDNNLKTSWISELTPQKSQPISIIVDFLADVFVLNRIQVFFTSYPPSDVVIERYFNGSWFVLQRYSLNCTQFDACISLPFNLNKQILNGFTLIWSKKLLNTTSVHFLRASQVKLTLNGFYDVVKSDLRKLYYSISEFKVLASCDCNGYADKCNTTTMPYKCQCDETSYTQGRSCEKCLDSHNNKAYESRYTNLNATCELCNCSSETTKCVYDEESKRGVCLDCKNNTEGLNCEMCKRGFYRSTTLNSCESCECNLNGTLANYLNECDSNGFCKCKANVDSIKCDRCKEGYYALSSQNPLGCQSCVCHLNGTHRTDNGLVLCDEISGRCKCINKQITGFKCNQCLESYFSLPSGCSKQCKCNSYGAMNSSCDLNTGQCYCKANTSGLKCEQCAHGLYNLTFFGCANKCNCSERGSIDNCDIQTGVCTCKEGYVGRECSQCDDGFYETTNGDCLPCNCNFLGTLNMSQNCERLTGTCSCDETTQGVKCDQCKLGYWGLPNPSELIGVDLTAQSGCKKCDCDRDGTISSGQTFLCDAQNGQCPCKPFREGIKCEKCVSGYFLVELDSKECIRCECHPTGTVPGTSCDFETGECVCKTYNGVSGTRCDECLQGFYGFQEDIGSCQSCECNQAGSLSDACDFDGKCACKDLVTGVKCDSCAESSSNLNVLNPFGCSKRPSRQSSPIVEQKESNAVMLRWNLPFYPNGIIDYYLLFRNNSLIFNSTSQNDTSFNDTSIEPYTLYNYVVESFNEQGSARSRPISILTFPGRPCCKFYYKILRVNSRSIDVQWMAPEKLNGQSMEYVITLTDRQSSENVTTILAHNQLNSSSYSITGLNPYTQYQLSMSACNRNVKEIYCLIGIDQNFMRLKLDSSSSVFTLQDRPQHQPSPNLIQLKAKSASFAILRPEKPNGIVILYELWLKKLVDLDEGESCDDNIVQGKLVCALEEWYDPFGQEMKYKNQTKICTLNNLKPYTWYSLSVAASTIIGRGEFSPRLRFMTEEARPLCSPKIVQATSQTFDTVLLEWLPQVNNLTHSFRDCIRGKVVTFQVFLLSANGSLVNIANTTQNRIVIGNLNSSTSYLFKLALCNQIGCALNENFTLVNTISAPPDRNQSKPEFILINASTILLKWNLNRNDRLMSNNLTNMTYKLERFSPSFSFPPLTLESGIRFHGYNYFNFKASHYYPEGYPFFGVNLTLKQIAQESSIFYYAESQNNLNSIQSINSRGVYVSNIDECFSYLTVNMDIRDKWTKVRTLRTNDETLLGVNNDIAFENLTRCQNIEINDVVNVYIGGVPRPILKSYEPKLRKSNNGQEVRLSYLNGCIKDASTLIRFAKLKPFEDEPSIESINFRFDDSEVSPGEAVGSNTFFGCPTSGLDNSSLYFLGYGFLSFKLNDQLITNQFLSYEALIRTQLGRGILFFAYDLINSDFLLINLVNSTAISVRMSYYANIRNIDSFTRTLTLKYTNVVRLNVDLANGQFFDFKFNLNLTSFRLVLSINNTLLINDNLAAQLAAQNLIFQSTKLDLFIHLSSEYFIGGVNLREANDKIENILDDAPSNLLFNSQFNLLNSLKDDIYFSGCFKNIRVKGKLLDFNDDTILINSVKYRHVRFDGCPTGATNRVEFLSKEMDTFLGSGNVETIFMGNGREASDRRFLPSTEYFYRVTASNPYGIAFSDWTLLRAPDAVPFYKINISLIDILFTSGYKFSIVNITNYCVYCKGLYLKESEIFSGIITKIGFIINQKDDTKSILKDTTFNCQDFCYEDLDEPPLVHVDTQPVQNYTIQVDVCTQFECKRSDIFTLKTPVEPPIEVNVPIVVNKTINSLNLRWRAPNRTHGIIQRYILRAVNLNSMQNIAIYSGLRRSFNVKNLRPFRKYTFFLEACNLSGCNSSDLVTYITAERPPSNVSVPTIIKKTQDSLLIKWDKPTSKEVSNGIVTNYILFVNEVIDDDTLLSPISLVYNIAICSYCSFYIQNVLNLRSGVLYAIRLSVCTGGGCKNSSELYVRTNESEPHVDNVVLMARLKTPQSIQVSWNRTRTPNGKIILYKLYLNDHIIYQGLNTNFLILNLNAFTFYRFYVDFCNSFACSRTRVFKLSTDEDLPRGMIDLEAKEVGANEIKLRFRSSKDSPFISNGHVTYAVYVQGAFIDLCFLPKSIRSFKCIRNSLQNLLNATMLNVNFGITQGILPNSNYSIYINASNTKGFVLSNRVNVMTRTDRPKMSSSPIAINITSRTITLEWAPPLLINSHDTNIFYQVEMKQENSSKIRKIFEKETLATYATIQNLEPFTSFSFRLRVVNSFGKDKSKWSEFYRTLEELPARQGPVEVLNIKSKSVSLKWQPPKEPNGLIRYYYLSVFKNDLLHGVFVVNGQHLKFTIRNLRPHEEYLIVIASCNSIGCTFSFRHESPRIKTLQDKPEKCQDLVVSSPNSYSIRVSWSLPRYTNGPITYFIIERKIISLTSDLIKRQPPKYPIRSYRFSPQMFNFTNFDDIESCGLYSFRLFAYNSMGYCSTSWQNVTVKESKPLFVYTPDTIQVNSTSVTIEWQKPMSYCKIILSTIILKQNKIVSTYNVDNMTLKLIINNLIPFTNYQVTLRVCVTQDLCTESKEKSFQTLGTSPSGIQAPLVKIVSSKIVSLNWYEPRNKNGKDLSYQLIRSKSNSRSANATQMIYFGNKTFFIDTNIKSNHFYRYMLVFSNEFGNTLSNWSSVIHTFSDVLARNSSRRTELLMFDLNAKCDTPSIVRLNWSNYDLKDLRKYLKTFSSIKMANPDATLDDYQILLIEDLTLNIERNKTSLDLKLNHTSLTSYLIRQLYSHTEYTFSIRLHMKLKSLKSSMNEIKFEISSEKVTCNTTSIIDAFDEVDEPIIKIHQIDEEYANVSIKISSIIEENYETLHFLISDGSIHPFTERNASFRVGPLKTNHLYHFSVQSCNRPFFTQNVKNEIYTNETCIESKSIKYLMSTGQDDNLPSMNVQSLNTSTIKIYWDQNNTLGLMQEFTLYRRFNSCQTEKDMKPLLLQSGLTRNHTKINCNGILYDRLPNHECCDANYLLKKYSEFMICCGGKFYMIRNGYKCCAGLKYVQVPDGQICCPLYGSVSTNSLKETRLVIGHGDSCCFDKPYFEESKHQICCKNKLVPRLRLNKLSYYETLLVPNKKSTLNNYECEDRPKVCEASLYEQIFRGNRGFVIDSNLKPNVLYEYKLCAKNVFGASCNKNLYYTQSLNVPPDEFNTFSYKIINESSIEFKWKAPLKQNGHLTAYHLYRDNSLIYTGLALKFIDTKLEPFRVHYFTIEACNKAGCVLSNKTLFICTKEKPLDEKQMSFNLRQLDSASIELKWNSSLLPNGIMRNYKIEIKEIYLKIVVRLRLRVNQTVAFVSCKNTQTTSINLEFTHVYRDLIQKEYKLVFHDLLPNSIFTIGMQYCNRIDCVSLKNRVIKTKSLVPSELSDPLVIALDSKNVDLIWRRPTKPNGDLVKYCIYLNDEKENCISFNDNNHEIYSHQISKLSPSTTYSFKIQVINSENLTLINKNKVFIQTPRNDLVNKCKPTSFKRAQFQNETLNVMNLVEFQVVPKSARQLSFKFENKYWRNFLICVNETSLSTKLLVFSYEKGMQTFDFPFNNDNTNGDIQYEQTIFGLKANTLYSIRFTAFNQDKTYTSQEIRIKTLEDVPCCKIDAPRVNVDAESKQFIIKWIEPDQLNSDVMRYQLVRGKLRGLDCFYDRSIVEKESKVDLKERSVNDLHEDKSYFLNRVTLDYMLIETNDLFYDSFGYYVFKIIALNNVGELESNWSEPTLIWQFIPSVPASLIISNVHSSGFSLNFKEPLKANSIISHYLIRLEHISLSKKTIKESIIIKSNSSCHHFSTIDYNKILNIPLNGLLSNIFYTITLFVYNTNGDYSTYPEKIQQLTQPSAPKVLRALKIKLDRNIFTGRQSIVFNFSEPKYPNGITTSFNLYLINTNLQMKENQFDIDDLVLLYSGLQKEYQLIDVKPSRRYTFTYSVCNQIDCTFKLDTSVVETYEERPRLQRMPVITKDDLYNCFHLSWQFPQVQNGKILKFELYKLSFSVKMNTSHESHIITLQPSNETNQTLVYDDCDLKMDYSYSYKVKSVNTEGSTQSNYTRMYQISSSLPSESNNLLNKIKFKQLNHRAILLNWTELHVRAVNEIGDEDVYCNIFRNQTQIGTFKLKSNTTTFTFVDYHQFLPKTIYYYQLQLCINKSECSIDNNTRGFLIQTFDRAPVSVDNPKVIQYTNNFSLVNTSGIARLLTTAQSIVEYQLYLNESLIYRGLNETIRLSKLKPYAKYYLVIRVCTFVHKIIIEDLEETGCKASNAIELVTFEDFPQELNPPELINLNRTNRTHAFILIKWSPPKLPNGLLKLIELKRDGRSILKTTNVNTNSHEDILTLLSRNYLYELIYENSVGSVRAMKIFELVQELPHGLKSPKCTSKTFNELIIDWSEPEITNGRIMAYVISYKSSNKKQNITIDTSVHNTKSLLLKSLEPTTMYEIEIFACNTRGCISGTKSTTCKTKSIKITNLRAPICYDFINEISNLISIHVSWKIPLVSYGQILNYSLVRQDKNKEEKVIYTSLYPEYVDFNVKAYSSYKYSILVLHTYGRAQSNWTEFFTRPMRPLNLNSPGVITHLYSDFIVIRLELPNNLNGYLQKIIILYRETNGNKSLSFTIKEIYSSTKDDEKIIDKLLNETKIDGLKSNTKYELKTQICNQIACITSTHSLVFETIARVKITDLKASDITKSSIRIEWTINKIDFKHNNLLEYKIQIKSLTNGSFEVYYVFDDNFVFTDLRPFTFYIIIISPIDSSGTLLDTKCINVTTLPDRPLYKNPPVFELKQNLSLNSNRSFVVSIEFDWSNSFDLNGELIYYVLKINNITKYIGINTNYTLEALDDCKRLSSQIDIFFIDNLYIQIEVMTNGGSVSSDIIKYDYDCELLSSSSSVYSDQWWSILLVILSSVILLVIVWLLLYYCTRRSSSIEKQNLTNIDLMNFNKLHNNSELKCDDTHDDDDDAVYLSHLFNETPCLHDSIHIRSNDNNNLRIVKRIIPYASSTSTKVFVDYDDLL